MVNKTDKKIKNYIIIMIGSCPKKVKIYPLLFINLTLFCFQIKKAFPFIKSFFVFVKVCKAYRIMKRFSVLLQIYVKYQILSTYKSDICVWQIAFTFVLNSGDDYQTPQNIKMLHFHILHEYPKCSLVNKSSKIINLSIKQQTYLSFECIGHCESWRNPTVCINNMCRKSIDDTLYGISHKLIGSDN